MQYLGAILHISPLHGIDTKIDYWMVIFDAHVHLAGYMYIAN